MLRKGVLFVVSGPSGVGKSTLCKRILTVVPGVRLSISCTTRHPRPTEQHGREYWFVDKTEFRRMIDQQEFVEWAEVYGQFYGTPWKELTQVQEHGTDTVLDIDVQGARQVMKSLNEAVTVFVMPPSLKILRNRLQSRGTDTPDMMAYRFQQAQDEIRNYGEYHYTISNEDVEQATKEFQSIIFAERLRTTRVVHRWLQENGLMGNEEGEHRPVNT